MPAIHEQEDFDGFPTSGSYTTDSVDMLDPAADPHGASNWKWTEGEQGLPALTAVGSTFGFQQVTINDLNPYRLRAYVRRRGDDPTGHADLFAVMVGSPGGAPNGTTETVQIRNTTGFPVHHRADWTTEGTTDPFPKDTWWRFEYAVGQVGPSGEEGTLLEVWYDPDSDGEPDHSSFAAVPSPRNTTRIAFGASVNASAGSDYEVDFQYLASTYDGGRVGPRTNLAPQFPEAPTDLWFSQIPAGMLGRWTPVEGADGYVITLDGIEYYSPTNEWEFAGLSTDDEVTIASVRAVKKGDPVGPETGIKD